MAITKEKKQEISAKLEAALKSATSIAFVRFSKLKVADASALRKELKKDGVSYLVAKKTLIKRALTNQGYEGTLPELPGEMAIAWSSDDATAPHRGIHAYGKKLKGALSLVGGVFEKAYLDATGAVAVATIPPVPVLRGMFANIINSPRSRFAIALGEVAKTKTA